MLNVETEANEDVWVPHLKNCVGNEKELEHWYGVF